MIGTNDEHDLERAAPTYRVITEEVWPRAEHDGIIIQENSIPPCIPPLWNFVASLTCCFHTLCRAQERGDYLRAGALAGQLFTGLVWRASAQQGWYWARALDSA